MKRAEKLSLTAVLTGPPSTGHGTDPTVRRSTGGHDSFGRAMLGLVLVWVTLMLLFKAHTMSDTHVQIAQPMEHNGGVELSLMPLLRPQQKLLMPIKLSTLGTTSDTLGLITSTVRFHYDPDRLPAGINDQVQRFEFSNMTLGQTLHELVGSDETGIALRDGEHLEFLDQELEFIPGDGFPSLLHWRSTLALLLQPLVVNPTGKADIQFAFYLQEPTTIDGSVSHVVFELWGGPTWLTAANIPLDEDGQGSFSLVFGEHQVEVHLYEGTRVDKPDLVGAVPFDVELTILRLDDAEVRTPTFDLPPDDESTTVTETAVSPDTTTDTTTSQ